MMSVNPKMTTEEILSNPQVFLKRYDVEAQFSQSKLDWEQLEHIARHFDNIRSDYEEIALSYVKAISNFDHIHSVKYRVKKVDSLLVKIIEKSCDGLEEFEPINENNYMIHIDDLIGVRVLHVFKRDCSEINRQLRKSYNKMIIDFHIKLKSGDRREMYKGIIRPTPKFEENETYRSIHYTLWAKDIGGPKIEIQVRTVFEEAWSEINHKLIYKNKNLEGYFFLMQATRVLSALAGECDNLGDLMKEIHDEYVNKTSSSSENEMHNSQEKSEIDSHKIMQGILSDFLHRKK